MYNQWAILIIKQAIGTMYNQGVIVTKIKAIGTMYNQGGGGHFHYNTSNWYNV